MKRWRVTKTQYGEWLAARVDFGESYLRPTWRQAYDMAYYQSTPCCTGCGNDVRIGLHGYGSEYGGCV